MLFNLEKYYQYIGNGCTIHHIIICNYYNLMNLYKTYINIKH